jgi:hypothetical protein
VVLSVVDGVLTLKEGGLEIEGNPVLRLMLQDQVHLFWLHKTAGVALCAWVLGRYAPVLLWTMTGVLACVFVIHAVVLSW